MLVSNACLDGKSPNALSVRKQGARGGVEGEPSNCINLSTTS